MRKHIHKWVKTKKWIIKDGFLNRLFLNGYLANISRCKCGEWYYTTTE